MSSIGFAALISRLSPVLIVMLSITSGGTTYYGLSLFVAETIAIPVAVAIQIVIVLSTLHLARAHWRASKTRVIVALVSVATTTFVSVYFSYFTFHELSQSATVREQRYLAVGAILKDYAAIILQTRSEGLTGARRAVQEARAKAEAAYGGTNPVTQEPILVGKGRMYDYFLGETRRAEEELQRRQLAGKAEALIADLIASFVKAGPDGLTREESYRSLQELLSQVAAAATEDAAAVGAPDTSVPVLPSYVSYVRITPTLRLSDETSRLPLLLALLVDCLTIILSYWLERAPFGTLSPDGVERTMRGLLSFTEWSINANDQLQFRLLRTERERVAGYDDSERLLCAAELLNRGYLRRVDDMHAEFCAPLYQMLDSFYRAAGLNGVARPILKSPSRTAAGAERF